MRKKREEFSVEIREQARNEFLKKRRQLVQEEEILFADLPKYYEAIIDKDEGKQMWGIVGIRKLLSQGN
jgi:Importin beta binding domain